MKNIPVTISAVVLLTLSGIVPLQAAPPSDTPPPLDKSLSTVTSPATKEAITTSVLERFRTHAGPRTPAALTALFAAPAAATIRQQPEVALSDGDTAVKISIAVGSEQSKAPNIAFEGAKLISLKHNKGDKWDIEALPVAGSWNTTLILQTGSVTREVPLTVAPVLPAGTDLSEQGFIAFLGGPKTSVRPLLDLNNDGKFDYQDDYIFTANYLVRSGSAAAPDTAQSTDSQTPPEQTPQSQVQETAQPAEQQVPASVQDPSQAPGISGNPDRKSVV